ncbi:hypothetical protein OHQ88_23215 [Micromonospora zamorensis]|uniref:Vitamin K-dependent gamma-carboxylase n=1 Tax=Micromonospora zamorensis TaxID=709883 RepID=A0ABZ1PBU6_9ACTN
MICTYILAAGAELHLGGLGWLTDAVLARATIRPGTDLADLNAQVPHLLIVAQFGIVAFELLSPVVVLLPPRWRLATVGFFYSFHAVTIATIIISFVPHLAAMTSFLPLERVRPLLWARRLTGLATPAPATDVPPADPPDGGTVPPDQAPVGAGGERALDDQAPAAGRPVRP